MSLVDCASLCVYTRIALGGGFNKPFRTAVTYLPLGGASLRFVGDGPLESFAEEINCETLIESCRTRRRPPYLLTRPADRQAWRILASPSRPTYHLTTCCA